MNGLFSVLSELTAIAGPYIAKAEAGALSVPGPWSGGDTLTSLTIPAQTVSSPGATITDPSDPLYGTALPSASGTIPAVVYLFDAVFKVQHTRELRRTEHPIQPGAGAAATSITDHAYQLPARVTLEIGMSDAMQGFSPASSLAGAASSRSVSAYQTLIALLQSRQLVTLTTRLATYPNMLVEAIESEDTARTRRGLRATVTLGEVFLADATASGSRVLGYGEPGAVGDSDRPQTTGATPQGTVQATPVPDALTAQHALTSAVHLPSLPATPGAGNWSSTNSQTIGAALA